jgi:undecaprenyl-phosphate 4-deoxy-4-formamido-L-arabinose transferase
MVSVVVPVFNGGEVLRELYRSLEESLGDKYLFEVLFVFDSGSPESWSVVKELSESGNNRVRGFRLKDNYGQHAATLFGIARARGEYVVTMDEDMQHNPAIIPDMVKIMEKGLYDVVYARFKQPKHRKLRVRLSGLFRRLLIWLIPGIYPGYSSFRLIRPYVAEKICRVPVRRVFIEGLLAAEGYSYGSVNAEHQQRLKSESSYTALRLLHHTLSIIIGYSLFRRNNMSRAFPVVAISEI